MGAFPLQPEPDVKPGDQIVIHGIGEQDFHTKAAAFKTKASERGIVIAAIYHVPIQTGILLVKEVQKEQR